MNARRHGALPREGVISLALCSCLAAAAGCGPDAGSDSDLDAELAAWEAAQEQTFAGGECSGSKYNCKLPCAPRDRNRIVNDATGHKYWPLTWAPGLRDGVGNVRGRVADDAVMINCGLRRRFEGRDHVYAWAARLASGVRASGWVREDALRHGPIRRMPTARLEDPGQGDYDAIWTVTGGDPAAFGELKVLPKWTAGGVEATDYLRRPGDVVNLCYNLPGRGGVAIDTFPVNVPFRRARGVGQIEIKLYQPGGTVAQGVLPFIYGHVGGRYGWIARDALATTSDPGTCTVRCCDGSIQGPTPQPGAAACHEASKGMCAAHGHVLRSRYNGVLLYRRSAACGAAETIPAPGAADAEPEPAPPAAAPAPAPAPTGQCYVRCCDASLHGPLALPDPQSCHVASQGICSDRGFVKRSEFDGAEVYERQRFCWAKCKSRIAYHRLDDVTAQCTEQAAAWCSVGDRGGLLDAKWDPCDPN